MAQRNPEGMDLTGPSDLIDPTERTGPAARTGPVGPDAVARALQAQATDFLRALRLHRESSTDSGASVEAARTLRWSARRIGGCLHTFRPLVDREWADALRPELAWLAATLGREHDCSARLTRLIGALHRLSGTAAFPPDQALRGAAVPAPARRDSAQRGPGTLHVGAAKAGALLERQITLARTRAHSAALQALGSGRFHAVADQVALLASDVPLARHGTGTEALGAAAADRLTDAVGLLPLCRAGHPYNAEALAHGLAADPAPDAQDAPWNQVRLLLRLHRYAREILDGSEFPLDVRLFGASQALDRHRDAAEAATAAASAARTPRIAPATAYALGILHADQRHEVEAARFAFQRLWVRT